MVANPEKELRFTRSGQAVQFCILGAVLIGIAVTLAATGYYREINPLLPHPAWAIPFLVLGGGCFWLSVHLAKHAYLILSPLGVEIFPFFRPKKGMQVVMWQEIVDAEIDEEKNRMTLHFNPEKTSGLHLSMRPVSRKLRSLLAKAVLGRVSQRDL
ncbi:MAG: hypothetical protein AB8D78_12335 [Akkermansiaceae bacterium]